MHQEMKEKVGCFIPVRLTSTRLVAKQLLKIGNKFLIEHLIDGIKRSKNVGPIVLCAPNEPESLQFEEIAKENQIHLYIYDGDVNDVVGRLTSAAKQFDTEICILASGDCPLIEGRALDQLINPLIHDSEISKAVFAKKEGKQVLHEGIRVERRWVWERADALSNTPELREHQFVVVDYQPEKFRELKEIKITAEAMYYDFEHRMSVDTPSDIKFMRMLYHQLSQEEKNFTMEEAVLFLKDHPELLDINKQVKQKGVYDASDQLGMIVRKEEFLPKAMEYAHHMMNTFGLGITLFVPDQAMKESVEKDHLSAQVYTADSFMPLLEKENLSGAFLEPS